MQNGNPDPGGSWREVPRPVGSGGSCSIYVGLGFSLVALALALRDVDLAGVGVVIGAADGRLLGLALGTYLLTVTIKAARWRLLLSMDAAPSLSRAFSVLSVGLLVNALAPARLGELVRVYMIGESESQSKAFVLGTIAVEKLLDLLGLFLAVALLLSQYVLPDWLIAPVHASSLVLASLCGFLFLLVWRRNLVMRTLTRMAGTSGGAGVAEPWRFEQTKADVRTALLVTSCPCAWRIHELPGLRCPGAFASRLVRALSAGSAPSGGGSTFVSREDRRLPLPDCFGAFGLRSAQRSGPGVRRGVTSHCVRTHRSDRRLVPVAGELHLAEADRGRGSPKRVGVFEGDAMNTLIIPDCNAEATAERSSRCQR
jgi:hypothetical protein